MRVRWRGTPLIFILGFAVLLASCSNPAKVREQLLRQTPIGSTFDEVLTFCASNKLKCYQSTKAGYLNQDTGQTIGVNSIWAVVEERKETPLTARTVSAYWGFGSDRRLIDIWVWRTVDAP
jgi:hypothetical protein